MGPSSAIAVAMAMAVVNKSNCCGDDEGDDEDQDQDDDDGSDDDDDNDDDDDGVDVDDGDGDGMVMMKVMMRIRIRMMMMAVMMMMITMMMVLMMMMTTLMAMVALVVMVLLLLLLLLLLLGMHGRGTDPLSPSSSHAKADQGQLIPSPVPHHHASLQTLNAAGEIVWMTGQPACIMVGLTLLSIAIIEFLPKITKAIPGPLAAIGAVTCFVQGLGIETDCIGDLATIKGTLPAFSVPHVPFEINTLSIVMPFAVAVAAVGLIETLLTQNLVDEMTQTRSDTSKESMAQVGAVV